MNPSRTTREFRRTGSSPLSDDEVMLLDALFDVRRAIDDLRRDGFRECTNLPYEHGLDDTELEAAVSRLHAAGLVRRTMRRRPSAGDGRMWLALTARGGALWTRERLPDWPRYCTDRMWPTRGADRWMLSVQSPTLGIASAFLEAMIACRLIDADPHTVVVQRHERRRLVPWHTFPEVYELRVRYRPDVGGPFDPAERERLRAEYDRRRVWWSSIQELG